MPSEIPEKTCIKLDGKNSFSGSRLQDLFQEMNGILVRENRPNDHWPIELPEGEVDESALLSDKNILAHGLVDIYDVVLSLWKNLLRSQKASLPEKIDRDTLQEEASGNEVIKARRAVVERIIHLLEVSLKQIKAPRGAGNLYNENVQPIPGQVNRNFGKNELEEISATIRSLIRIANQDFNEAFSDREAGFVEIVRRIFNFIDNTKDPQTALWYLQNVLAKKFDDGRYPKDLDWKGQWEEDEKSGKNILKSRLKELKTAENYGEWVRKTEQGLRKLFSVLSEKDSNGAFQLWLVKSLFDKKIEGILSPVENVRWNYLLFGELAEKIDEISASERVADLISAIAKLAEALQVAQNRTRIAELLDEFRKKTIPELLKPKVMQ